MKIIDKIKKKFGFLDTLSIQKELINQISLYKTYSEFLQKFLEDENSVNNHKIIGKIKILLTKDPLQKDYNTNKSDEELLCGFKDLNKYIEENLTEVPEIGKIVNTKKRNNRNKIIDDLF